jgi:hypothetical protein
MQLWARFGCRTYADRNAWSRGILPMARMFPLTFDPMEAMQRALAN